MIERELGGRQRPMAILAGIAVAHQNVLARKSPSLVRDAPVFEQPDHGRNANRMTRRMNVRLRFLLGGCDALQHQHQRAPRRANVDGFIARV